MIVEHAHRHGDHDHSHAHEGGELVHEHGWHSSPGACWGDDTFGYEADAPPPTLGSVPMGWPIYVPHIPGHLRSETLEALDPFAYLLVDLSGSQFNYWELVRQLWSEKRDFVLVEHDIVPPPEFMSGFASCPEPWCVHDYRVHAGLIYESYGNPGAFGCVRFRSEIMETAPDALSCLTDRTWSHLDGLVADALRARGFRTHAHEPAATHLHEYFMSEEQLAATLALHGAIDAREQGEYQGA